MHRHPLFLPYAALAGVCFFWGTTYVAIRIAVESLPPLLLVATRFTASGSLLLTGALLAGFRLPEPKEALHSALLGILGLGAGSLCLSYAETWIPSSLAALLITTSPFWMVLVDTIWAGGERMRRRALIGMAIGLTGTALLVGPDALHQGLAGDTVRGFLLLQVGNISWACASIGQRRVVRHVSAVTGGAIQQLATGLALWIPTLALGQYHAEWSLRSAAATAYLMMFGSIVGYTAYVYALKKLAVPVVTMHVYVNPVVASVLGWLVFREPFGAREAVAMGVIFLGVGVVKRYGTPPPLRETAVIPSPEP